MMRRIVNRALTSITGYSSEARGPKKRRTKPLSCRVRLEQLEDRLVLSSDLGLPADDPAAGSPTPSGGTVTITETPAPENQAPTVSAGLDATVVSHVRDQGNAKPPKGIARGVPNKKVLVDATATLDATVSDDGLPAPGTLQTAWSKVSGKGGVAFADPSAVDTTARFNMPGTFVLRLTATDGQFTASDDVVITVGPPNLAPVVTIGPVQKAVDGQAVALVGSFKDDGLPNSGHVTTSWSVVTGPGSVTFAERLLLVTQASFTTPGNYTLRLTADDGELSGFQNAKVTVKRAPAPKPTGPKPRGPKPAATLAVRPVATPPVTAPPTSRPATPPVTTPPTSGAPENRPTPPVSTPPTSGEPENRPAPPVSTPPVSTPPRPSISSVPGKHIVVLNDTVQSPATVARQIGKKYGLGIDTVWDAALKGFAATVPDARLNALKADGLVRYVEPDGYLAPTLYSTGSDRINGEVQDTFITPDPVTGIAPDLQGIAVAVIDTGIDLKNSDLNVLGNVSFVRGPKTGQDDQGHGTGVASLIGAKADRAGVLDADQGITGTAPGVGLYAVKVLDRNGSGTLSQVINGVNWVAKNAAAKNILFANMSLGASGYSQAMHDAIAGATAKGVTFLVAAGNERTDAANTSPGGFDDTVITVSALADSDGEPGGLGTPTGYGADDTLATFSNYGSVVDVIAPGVNIRMDKLGGGTWVASGTSMATPIATGVAVLVVSADRRLGIATGFDAQTPASRWSYIRSRLIETGTAPQSTVLTDGGQQVLNEYAAASSDGQWNNDPDGVAERLVNAANAYALG